jgi:hypothetical protein
MGKVSSDGASYHHLYSSPDELVEAQNYSASQHLNLYKVFGLKRKTVTRYEKEKLAVNSPKIQSA